MADEIEIHRRIIADMQEGVITLDLEGHITTFNRAAGHLLGIDPEGAKGLTFAEVGAVLNMASLNQGVLVSCEGCNTSVDSTFARVFRQSPGAGGFDRIAMGSSIDVWLTMDTVGLAPVSGWNDPVHFEPNETNDTIH